ncbi:unnamed protein product, partial [Litomosoides sigmodontis]
LKFDQSQSQEGIQKHFQYQRQQYPSYLRQDLKKIDSNPATNPGTNFKNIPVNNLNGSIGALVTIQLQQYSNPNLALPNGYTCACPSGMQCPYLQEGSTTCLFSFTIILSASNQSTQIIESPFIMVPKSPINSGIWTNDNIVNMTVKPNTIEIIIHHLGVVINQATGSLEYFNHLIPIDTFVISLDNYYATPYGTAPNIIQQTIIGKILGTTLQLAYYIQCVDNKYGSNCDLKCTLASSSNLHVACTSIVTGMQHSCKYASDLMKVFDCAPCPYGLITNQTKCNTPSTGPIIYNLVSPAFRIWTIVLGFLLGIAMIFITVFIVTFMTMEKRGKMKSKLCNRRHIEGTYSTIYRTYPSKTLLSRENAEWQPGKIRPATRDSGVSSRTATSEEPVEDQYVRGNVASLGRREAHV